MVPLAMPTMPFFRHLKTRIGIQVDVLFKPKYFNVWPLRAQELRN